MARKYLSLRDLAKDLKKEVDYKPLLEKFSTNLRTAAMRRFETSTDPDGKPWAPLLRPRPRTGGSDKPLADTGGLRSSMTVANAPYSTCEITARKLTQGTNRDGGTIHQYGGVIKPKNAKFLAIPATQDAAYYGSPKNWVGDKLLFRWGENGGVAVTGKGLNEIVQYYFTKQVTIPARPFAGIDDQQADDFAEDVADFVADAKGK